MIVSLRPLTPTAPRPEESVEALPGFVRALLRPQAYQHPASDVHLHETHISWVILAGPYAYKLKKAVDFGFLDFSTLERRVAACADEVRLNRRLCPDVYLGVVDIVRRDDAYFVDGPGEMVEPAVWMRRLPAEGMLPALLDAGRVDPWLVRRIARHLAGFHLGAATGPGVDEYGSPESVAANWAENFEQTAPFVERVLPAEQLRFIQEYVGGYFRRGAALLTRRVAQGRIRECHGDLHAASICVEGDRLHFFDCLEFNARFRCSDIAAEVAFLAMDLDHHGRADLAGEFVEAYARESGDADLADLLDFYACYRAYVRAKVFCLRLAERDVRADEAARLVAEARAYFDLAWAYAGGLPRPMLFVTMGLPGSGKSRLARELARRLGLVHLSSDLTRKELAGLRPTQHVEDAFGTGIYNPSMTRRTYALLRRRAGRWLRRGRGVVIDATFGRPSERAALRRAAAECGAPLAVLLCHADERTLRTRLRERAADPRSASDARLEIWPALKASFIEPVELPEVIPVDTTTPPVVTVERTVAALRDLVGARRLGRS